MERLHQQERAQQLVPVVSTCCCNPSRTVSGDPIVATFSFSHAGARYCKETITFSKPISIQAEDCIPSLSTITGRYRERQSSSMLETTQRQDGHTRTPISRFYFNRILWRHSL